MRRGVMNRREARIEALALAQSAIGRASRSASESMQSDTNKLKLGKELDHIYLMLGRQRVKLLGD
jgi:hypothetical protein